MNSLGKLAVYSNSHKLHNNQARSIVINVELVILIAMRSLKIGPLQFHKKVKAVFLVV